MKAIIVVLGAAVLAAAVALVIASSRGSDQPTLQVFVSGTDLRRKERARGSDAGGSRPVRSPKCQVVRSPSQSQAE